MINIKANKREKSSSGFTNKLRSDGFIPAILYGGKSENEKISIALSGGVDSTLVLSLIRKINPDINIQAVSIKFANSVDETSDAAKIAERFEANHHIVELENYLSELPNAIYQVQSPFWDLHWYYVTKKASTISNVLASGDGGDEIFSGYTFRYEKFLSKSKYSVFFSKVIGCNN